MRFTGIINEFDFPFEVKVRAPRPAGVARCRG